jgi:oligosaccharyltransferase complex subunit alpha (ribophorin I)
LRIILPEGATDIKANLPFTSEQTMEKTFSYLDVKGRPTLVVKKKLVFDHHYKEF